MHNLQRFSCWESFIFTPGTFARLVAGPTAPSLQELGATMEDWPLPPYRLSLDESRPTCPQLRKVHFILPRRQVDWDNCRDYVAYPLKTSAAHLETLALDLSSSRTDLHAPELFSGIRSLQALEVLRLPTATDLASIPRAPGLQCLQLDCDHSRIGRDGITGRRSLPSSLTPTSRDFITVTSTFLGPYLRIPIRVVLSMPSSWTKPPIASTVEQATGERRCRCCSSLRGPWRRLCGVCPTPPFPSQNSTFTLTTSTSRNSANASPTSGISSSSSSSQDTSPEG